ncbi:MAG: hypothetical protein IT184_11305 [Acidobacteria bacterium]|nr:hypothetical protein [Acidobacteriota bacterium]
MSTFPMFARRSHRHALVLAGLFAIASVGSLAAQRSEGIDYRVLSTSKTSTLEKEMNDAAQAGFRFEAVMGGETGIGGKEVVAIMSRAAAPHDRYEYRLLATNKTSTMQKELQQAAELGFEYRGQTVFESMFGGKEVTCILERNVDRRGMPAYQYKLLATTKTSTMQKELQAAGADGFEIVGMTIGKTAMSGNELVTIVRRRAR